MVLLSPFKTKSSSLKLSNDIRGKNTNTLREKYKFMGKLGKGGAACVYEFRIISKHVANNDLSVACKVLSKTRYSSKKIYQEIKLLSELTHPNIVRFHEFYESKEEIFIVMQNAKGGELFNLLRDHGAFDEINAKILIRSLLEALRYLHSKSIVHRDVKLENILLAKKVCKNNVLLIEPQDVLLVDFGLAKKFSSQSERTRTRCGSKYYVAPEIWLGRPYNYPVDLWSVGVVMYMVLTNNPPFYKSNISLETAIVSGKYRTPKVSVEARLLLKQLLTINPCKRINCHAALKNTWLTM